MAPRRPASRTTGSRARRRSGAGTGRSPGRCSTTSSPWVTSPSPGATASSRCATTCPSGSSPPRCWPDPSRRGPRRRWSSVRRAAVSHGVATAQCLKDYFRMHVDDVRPAVATLVESGELVPVTIEGWKRPAYLPPGRPAPTAGRGARAAQPVRPGGVGARAHRADLRLPLPHRDLHPGGEARPTATTCCRSCSATGSSRGWT